MDILITGITGKLGSELLNNFNNLISILYTNTKDKLNFLFLVRNDKKQFVKEFFDNLENKTLVKYDFFDIELTREEDLYVFFKKNKKFDLVIWLASEVNYNKPYEELYKVNVKPLEILKENCNVDKILYISSIAVYNEKTNNQEICETNELKPASVYGLSKLRAEEIIYKFNNYVILRPAIIIGKEYLLGFETVYKMLRKKKFVYINKKAHIPLVYVKDLVNAILFSLDILMKNKNVKEIFNVCNDNITQETLVNYVCEKSLFSKPFLELPSFLVKLFLKRDYHFLVDQLKYDRIINSKKIKDYGFVFKYSWKTGIDEILEALNLKYITK
ncbi:MAG: NAD(P)-dependent oxidoreductase [Candidatus Aenigmatarchaeota archaeon]